MFEFIQLAIMPVEICTITVTVTASIFPGFNLHVFVVQFITGTLSNKKYKNSLFQLTALVFINSISI